MDPKGTLSEAAELQAEADRLVNVALYTHPHEAHLARLRLEAEGIECRVRDEHMAGLAWPPTTGVRLGVRAWQVDRARRVLDACEPRSTSDHWVTGDLEAPRCPSCGSLRVRPAASASDGAAGRWRVLGLPLPFLRRRAGCRHCGHRWTPA